jgi:hypothetical protein
MHNTVERTLKTLVYAALAVSVLAGCSKDDQGPAGPAGPQGLAGSQGPQGVQGPPGATGGGLYTSRGANVYCNPVPMGIGPPLPFGVVAHCDGDLDLPITGSCAAVSVPPNVTLTLVFNGPVSWDANSTGPAGWSCAWADTTGGQVNVSQGQATICCIRHP